MERLEEKMLAQVTTNPPENGGPRKSKVSSAMEVSGGLGGPKAMAKAAADGHGVNIRHRPVNLMKGRRT